MINSFQLSKIESKNDKFQLHIIYSGDYTTKKIISYIDKIKLINLNNSEEYILAFKAESIEDKIVCEIEKDYFPLDESEYSINFLFLLNKDIIEVNIINSLTENFVDQIENNLITINSCEKGISTCCFSIKKKSNSNLVISDVYSFRNSTELIFDLRDNPLLTYSHAIKEIYLENNFTKERLIIEPDKLTYKEKKIKLKISLSNILTYNGPWNMGLILKDENNDFTFSLSSYKDYYSEFTSVEGKAGVYRLYRNQFGHLQIDLFNYTEDLLKNTVDNVLLKDSKIEIHFTSIFNSVFTQKDSLTSVVFRSRKNHSQKVFPLINTGYSTYIAELDIMGCNKIFDDGIWDIFVNANINDCILEFPISQKQEFIKSLVTLPGTIYNNKDIKCARFYLTKDNRLSLLITKEFYIADLHTISMDEDRMLIKGWIDLNTSNVILKKMILVDENNQSIKTNYKSEIKNNCYHFSIEIDCNDIKAEIEFQKRYSLLASLKLGEELLIIPVSFNYGDKEKYKSHIYPTFYLNEQYVIHPEFNIDNSFELNVTHTIKPYCYSIKKSSKRIELFVNISSNDLIFDRTQLILIDDRKEIELAIDNKDIIKNSLVFQIDKSTFSMLKVKEKQWELFIRTTTKEGKNFLSRLAPENGKEQLFPSTFKSGSIKMKKKKHLSVFRTRDNKMNIELRDIKAYESYLEEMKFYGAKLVSKFLKHLKVKPIWFIGENLAEVAQDNGIAFFKYLYHNKNDQSFYYISVEDNKNGDVLENYNKNVIRYDSFKHYVYYHLSELLIVSHGIRDVAPTFVHNKMSRNEKPVIYLQHGITAMKKLKFNRKSYNGMIKKFIVCSESEKEIFVKQMGFSPEQVCVTGFSRYDTLEDKSHLKKQKEIVIMPTWREWIEDAEFETSSFYLKYAELLKSAELKRVITENNVKLKFFMHIELQRKFNEYFQGFDNYIEIINVGDQTVKSILSESSLLITDYSSVVFDFHYLDKPVMFYQFDLEDYLKYRGSYVNMKNDLLGPTATTSEDLIALIKEYIKKDFKAEPRYKMKSKKYYKYLDRNNSERIYNEILSLKEEQKGTEN